MFRYMHSVLGLASFAMYYSISVAWHGGNPPEHYLDVMEAQVALIKAFIFLLKILCTFPVGFRSGEFAVQSSTLSLNQALVPLAVWAGAKSS